MTKLTRFFATCLLVVSISAVALADGDGGTVQGPPAPPPAAQCDTDCSSPEASAPAQPAEDLSVDIVTEATLFASWFAMSIL
jgi:hypothetical protein